MFARMLQAIMRDVTGILSKVEVKAPDDVEAVEEQRRQDTAAMQYQHRSPDNALANEEPDKAPQNSPYVRKTKKVGRNDPCPCGSGKKYKQCHGKLT